MNVEIDKHDLFRNAIPGYVFLIVIFSFYAVTGCLDAIKETPVAIMAIVAGFPLGFIIHAIYREVFHTWSGEQAKMDEENAKILRHILIQGKLNIPSGNDKKLSHSLLLIIAKGDKSFHERIHFLISYIHALGGSAFAILLALIFMTVKKLTFLSSAMRNWNNWHHEQVFQAGLGFVWLMIAIVFWRAREPVKDSYRVSKEVLAETCEINDLERPVED